MDNKGAPPAAPLPQMLTRHPQQMLGEDGSLAVVGLAGEGLDFATLEGFAEGRVAMSQEVITRCQQDAFFVVAGALARGADDGDGALVDSLEPVRPQTAGTDVKVVAGHAVGLNHQRQPVTRCECAEARGREVTFIAPKSEIPVPVVQCEKFGLVDLW